MSDLESLTGFVNEPLWPGKPIINNFEVITATLRAYNWSYTLWNDKIWFCTFYSGNVNFDKLKNKGDVEKAGFTNTWIGGVLNSQLSGKRDFFFDKKNQVCGIEMLFELVGGSVPKKYLNADSVRKFQKYLSYLIN